MTILGTVLSILDRELNLQGNALAFTEDTKLRGSLPQLDSMAVISLVTALEEQLEFEFPEDQLDGAVGTLVACVARLIDTNQTKAQFVIPLEPPPP